MPRIRLPLVALLLLGSLLLAACRTTPQYDAHKLPDPRRFEREIDELLARDRTTPPPPGGVAFAGSSSFKNWTWVGESMAPLPVSNRGFGGSMTHDQLFYLERVVLPQHPHVIVYYCGDNDLANDEIPAAVPVANFKTFCQRVWAAQPRTRILYLSIKPSPSRQEYWPKMRDANRQIARWCAWQSRAEFIDLTKTLMPEPGQYKVELFQPDRLHINREGYSAWTAVIRPRLERAWAHAQRD